jgi:integrase
MASIRKLPNDTWRIEFTASDGRRQTLRVGKMTKRGAESVRSHVESILATKLLSEPMSRNDAEWAAGLSETLKSRLHRVGLIEWNASNARLGPFIDNYTKSRKTLKPRTIVKYKHTRNNLTQHFGEEVDLRKITPAEAEAFREWLTSKYSPATVARHIKQSRQFFKAAIDAEILVRNPFAKVHVGSMTNRDRQTYVDVATISKVLEACPDPEWRLVFGLARHAGLRIPSEALALSWGNVLWAEKRLVVHVDKLERYEGKETKIVPINPELYALLQDQFEATPEGEVNVIHKHRNVIGKNPGTQAQRIIERAGLIPWEKTFTNLRASCVTDWAKILPKHAVESFAGHSEEISIAHYRMTLDADFDTISGGGAKSDVIKAQKAPLRAHAMFCEDPQETRKAPCFRGSPLNLAKHCDDTQSANVGLQGLEPRTKGL